MRNTYLPGNISSVDQQLAARDSQADKEQKMRARRERARHDREQTAQSKGWLTAMKMHTAIVWVITRRDNSEVGNASSSETTYFQAAVKLTSVKSIELPIGTGGMRYRTMHALGKSGVFDVCGRSRAIPGIGRCVGWAHCLTETKSYRVEESTAHAGRIQRVAKVSPYTCAEKLASSATSSYVTRRRRDDRTPPESSRDTSSPWPGTGTGCSTPKTRGPLVVAVVSSANRFCGCRAGDVYCLGNSSHRLLMSLTGC